MEKSQKDGIPEILLRLTVKPFQPSLTPQLVSLLGYAKHLMDRGLRSSSVVLVDKEFVERLKVIYGFDKVDPTEWENLGLWQSESLPDDTYFVRYRIYSGYGPKEPPIDRFYILHTPGLVHEMEQLAVETLRRTMDGREEVRAVRKLEGEEIALIFTLHGGTRRRAEELAKHFTASVENVITLAVSELYRVCILGEGELGKEGE